MTPSTMETMLTIAPRVCGSSARITPSTPKQIAPMAASIPKAAPDPKLTRAQMIEMMAGRLYAGLPDVRLVKSQV